MLCVIIIASDATCSHETRYQALPHQLFFNRTAATKERREMIRELMNKVSRFVFTLILFSASTAHVILAAVPDANKPGLVAASVVAALIVAMYDIGVFRVECEI
jgi:hypothetical protein